MKLIPLTQGQFAQVDDEDFEWLSQYKWHARKKKNTYYAITNNKRMHRIILNPDQGQLVDHKDRNGLNNQRSNIRICTNAQNQMNKKARGSSKYLGVSFDKSTSKWDTRIKHNGVSLYLGRYKNEVDAALAYNKAAEKYHGEFANLNIIS